MKEASNHGGEGAANYKNSLPGASHLLNPKATGEATKKGKMSLHEDSAMCSETQTGKTSPFFPLFLEHLRQEEEAHARAGSSLTFPLPLPRVLTN